MIFCSYSTKINKLCSLIWHICLIKLFPGKLLKGINVKLDRKAQVAITTKKKKKSSLIFVSIFDYSTLSARVYIQQMSAHV